MNNPIHTIPLSQALQLSPVIPADRSGELAIIHYTGQSARELPDMNDYFALVLGIKGSSICTVDNFCFKLTANNLYLLKPQNSPVFQQLSNGFQCDIVLFKRSFLADIMIGESLIQHIVGASLDEPVVSALNQSSFKNIQHLYTRLDQEYHSDKLFHSQMLHLLFVELMLEVSRSSVYTPANLLVLPTRQQQLVSQFNGLVDQYFLTERTVKSYANRLYVTAKYLGEVVKEQTGLPALHLIHNRLFQESKYWLRISGLSIKEIAGKLNFDNSSHFSRFFKHISGYNPTDYQRLSLF